jgi:hypothetical protein
LTSLSWLAPTRRPPPRRTSNSPTPSIWVTKYRQDSRYHTHARMIRQHGDILVRRRVVCRLLAHFDNAAQQRPGPDFRDVHRYTPPDISSTYHTPGMWNVAISRSPHPEFDASAPFGGQLSRGASSISVCSGMWPEDLPRPKMTASASRPYVARAATEVPPHPRAIPPDN